MARAVSGNPEKSVVCSPSARLRRRIRRGEADRSRDRNDQDLAERDPHRGGKRSAIREADTTVQTDPGFASYFIDYATWIQYELGATNPNAW